MVLELSRRDEFAVITLNRPQALNALNNEMIGAIGKAIDEAAASDARAVLFIGAGDRAFCAGADITELQGNTVIEAKRFAERGQRVFAKLDTLSIPSVAVVNGYAFGGGLELALACTFRVASKNAKVGLPEIKLGTIPGYGGTQRLPRVVGEARALEIIMTGRMVSAEEAERIGLISRLIDGDALDGGIALAREFSKFSLPVLALAREAVMRAGDTPINEGLKIEAELNTLAFQTEDVKEGIAAFLGKREAKFKDA
jgi:enoyl-CoA hydratase